MSTLFRFVTTCSEDRTPCFGGTYRLQLQGGKVSNVKNSKIEQKIKPEQLTGVSFRLFHELENGSDVPPKRRIFLKLRDVTALKTAVCSVIATTTSNPSEIQWVFLDGIELMA
jgi:hypothetical protein